MLTSNQPTNQPCENGWARPHVSALCFVRLVVFSLRTGSRVIGLLVLVSRSCDLVLVLLNHSEQDFVTGFGIVYISSLISLVFLTSVRHTRPLSVTVHLPRLVTSSGTVFLKMSGLPHLNWHFVENWNHIYFYSHTWILPCNCSLLFDGTETVQVTLLRRTLASSP